VEIQAEAYCALMEGRLLHRIPLWLCIAVTILVALVPLALRPSAGLIAGVVLGIAWVALALMLFLKSATMLPVVPFILAAVGTPVGRLALSSWRDASARTVIERSFVQQLSAPVAETVLRLGPNALRHGFVVEASVLFFDIRGFTSYAESRPALEVVQTLTQVFEIVIPIISRFDGTVVTLLGDGLMATFGAPATDSEHRQKAITAAKAIVSELKVVNFGIGIASGQIMCGNVGSAERHQFTVIGDTVNLASRLQEESKVKGSKLVVASETLLEPDDQFHGPGEVRVRGRDGRQLVYWLR
jgi:adenylate cyclase